MLSEHRTGVCIIVVAAIIVVAGLILVEPVSQSADYHLFKDTRAFWGIPNFWNIVSNLPFFMVGILGIAKLGKARRLAIVGENQIAYYLFFFGVMLVSFGSAYYHFNPNNSTLAWDRLPMTVAFMALFSIVLSEFVSIRLGKALLLPMILCGVLSVYYWWYSESIGLGDLRYYAIVQFLPLLLIPVILIRYRPSFTNSGGYWGLLVIYIIAKLFEHFDEQTYALLVQLSGHSIKHLVAAVGIYWLMRSYEQRKRLCV